MFIYYVIWCVGEQLVLFVFSCFVSEQQFEDMIVWDFCILFSEWMFIGCQEVMLYGGCVDFLVIVLDVFLVFIELKCDCMLCEIIVQVLDYVLWVEQLMLEWVVQIFQWFFGGKSFDVVFQECFGVELDEEIFNQLY